MGPIDDDKSINMNASSFSFPRVDRQRVFTCLRKYSWAKNRLENADAFNGYLAFRNSKQALLAGSFASNSIFKDTHHFVCFRINVTNSLLVRFFQNTFHKSSKQSCSVLLMLE